MPLEEIEKAVVAARRDLMRELAALEEHAARLVDVEDQPTMRAAFDSFREALR